MQDPTWSDLETFAREQIAADSAVFPPTAYPEPGVYDVAQMITLLSASPKADIHYTLDGSPPTASSSLFDPYRLIAMQEFGEPVPEGKRTFTIRAIARVGDRTSEAKIFTYEVEPRRRDEYVSQELAPGVIAGWRSITCRGIQRAAWLRWM